MSTIDSANPPQEYPDIVGARPMNPFAANCNGSFQRQLI
jgi:hypothetical protein